MASENNVNYVNNGLGHVLAACLTWGCSSKEVKLGERGSRVRNTAKGRKRAQRVRLLLAIVRAHNHARGVDYARYAAV